LTADSGFQDEKKSGSGKNITDHIFESLITIFGFKILKFFYNSELLNQIQDPVTL